MSEQPAPLSKEIPATIHTEAFKGLFSIKLGRLHVYARVHGRRVDGATVNRDYCSGPRPRTSCRDRGWRSITRPSPMRCRSRC
jgi:hypothetical protein